MKTFFACLLLFTVVARAASPSLLSFEPTQFDTNTAYIKYIADWTNIDGIISPARDNTLVTITNQNVYGTWSTPSKVTLLSLGTNQLDMTLQSAWLLNSPTNDPVQVILSLSAGAYQGQHAFLLSQNGDESFTLPNYSEQYNVPGAYVILGRTNTSDWIGSTNRGIHLVYAAPDWVIEGLPTDPSVPGGGSTNIVATVGPGTLNTLAMFGPITSAVTNSVVSQTGTTNILVAGTLSIGTITNLIRASTSDLTYTNGSTSAFVNVSASTGTSTFGTTSGGHAIVQAQTGKSVYLGANGNSSGDVFVAANQVSPTTTTTLSLGTAANSWKDLSAGNPGSGTAVWKLGKKLSGSVLTLTTNYYEVMVDGVLGAIPIVTVTP